MKAESYDFRKPPRLAADLAEQLLGWLTANAALAAEAWGGQFPEPVSHAVVGLETVRPGDALAQLAETVIAYRAQLGPGNVSTLLAIPRPLALTLVAGLLGDVCTECLPDRPLTPIEESLSEYLWQQFTQSLPQAWTGGTPLTVALEGVEPNPRRTRMFPADENLVRIALLIRGPFGERAWQWLIPQKELTRLLGQTADGAPSPSDQASREHLKTLVGDVPLEVSVRLGSAALHVSELTGLRAGDLVLLDQPVGRPLDARVAGKLRFRVWPGRVGGQQAVQIESLIES